MNIGQIKNPRIQIKPSSKLRAYISTLKNVPDDSPDMSRNKTDDQDVDITNQSTKNCLENDNLLNLKDLHWLHKHILKNNEKVYLHELLEGSKLILPENSEILRNEDLEKRRQQLIAFQRDKEYNEMTKSVDSVKRKYPEDSFSYQVKQINRHIIAVVQVIVSVLAGFAFGFVGLELFTGSLDLRFRLLLGFICASVIGLVELYFLIKNLNE